MLSFRNLARRLHLWLGLSLGILLTLLGLTGAALVFYVEIDAALHPLPDAGLAAEPPGWQSPVWDTVLVTARREFPDHAGDWQFEADVNTGAIPARFYPSATLHDHHAEREMVWFSADGTRVVRSETWGQYLMSWLYELHMHLLAGETGSLLVGWGGLATLMILFTGLVSWWPRGSWRSALAFKRNAVSIRRLRDLHKLAALWSAPLLMLLVLTGVLLALPTVKDQVLSALQLSPESTSTPRSIATGKVAITLGQALDIAHAMVPASRLVFIEVPGDPQAALRLRVQQPGDLHGRFPQSSVYVDRYSGEVLAVKDVERGNAYTLVTNWIRPLHDGSIAGIGTRILAVVLGLLPAALLITGILYWRERIARRRHHHLPSTFADHRT